LNRARTLFAFATLTVLTLLFLSGAALGIGPSAGDLAGTLKDKKSNPIPNARIRFSGPMEGLVRSNGQGVFLAPDLIPGDYGVTISKPGYAAIHRNLVKIEANKTTALNLRMEWADPRSGAAEIIVQDNQSRDPLPDTTVDLQQNGFLVTRSTTDEIGTIVFPGLTPGFYNVVASRPGFFGGQTQNFRVREGQLTAATIRLNRDGNQVGRLQGTVRDIDGNPLNDARVKIVDGFTSGETETAPTGEYQFPSLIPGTNYALEVSKSGFATQVVGGLTVALNQTTMQNFHLVPNQAQKGSITGVVRNTLGQALASATVRMSAGPEFGQEVLTSPDGRYTFAGLAPGNYGVFATLAGHAAAGRSGIVVEAGRSAVVDLELASSTVTPGSIGGTVREQGSGQLLKDVLVEVTQGPAAGLSATTDASGGYVLPFVIPGGGNMLRFTRTDYQTLTRFPISVTSGLRTTVDAQLVPTRAENAEINGSVRRFGAGALAGVKVTVFSGPSAPLSLTTGKDGKFSFKNLIPGLAYGLRLEKKNFITLTRTGIDLSPGEVHPTGDLVMMRANQVGGMRVTVLDLATRPIAGAIVRIIEGPTRPGDGETDLTGRFEFEALLPGTYSIEVIADGFQRGQKGLIQVSAGSNAGVIVQLLRV
jgi:hypothetical protein